MSDSQPSVAELTAFVRSERALAAAKARPLPVRSLNLAALFRRQLAAQAEDKCLEALDDELPQESLVEAPVALPESGFAVFLCLRSQSAGRLWRTCLLESFWLQR